MDTQAPYALPCRQHKKANKEVLHTTASPGGATLAQAYNVLCNFGV